MKKRFEWLYQILTAVILLPLAAFSVKANEPRFEVLKIAEGVYAAIRTEPPGLTVNANSVFIINQEHSQLSAYNRSRKSTGSHVGTRLSGI